MSEKPRDWEKPTVMPLGSVESGQGTQKCEVGNSPDQVCGNGSSAQVDQCKSGNTPPSNSCASGNNGS